MRVRWGVRTEDPAKARRIIEAAIRLFAERAYHEVRMEDIAAQAQVAKGTLYLHYKDKEDLFQGIMHHQLATLVDQMEATLRDHPHLPPEEKLLAMNRSVLGYFERNPTLLDIMQRVEFLRFGAKSACVEETRGRLLGNLARILREFPSRAKATDEEITLEVVAHSGMMKEILHSLPRPWPEDLPERVTRLFVHGVGSADRGKTAAKPRARANAARR